MGSRSRLSKGLAQTRMTEVVATYLHSLMARQSTALYSCADGVPLPLERFPSFDYFCAEQEPSLPVEKYAERLVMYMRCSPEAFIFALVYLRRLLHRGCPIHTRCVHRLLLCAVLVAAKTRDDSYWPIKYYAQVGGVTRQDLAGMEMRFLIDMIDFRAEVSAAEYHAVMCDIDASMGKMNHSSSGMLSDDMGASLCDTSRSSSPSEASACTHSPQGTVELHVSPPAWSVDCEVCWLSEDSQSQAVK